MSANIPVSFGFSAMGHGRCDYEGFYGVTENMRYYGLHCHDFYECYIHLQGAKYFGIDNEVYQLEPNQLVLIPPFHMHGLMTEDPLIYYERAFLYLSGDMLRQLGIQQLDLVGMMAENAKNQRFMFTLAPKAARTCADLMQEVQKNNQRHSPWDRFSDFSYILPFLRIVLETMQHSAHVHPTVSIQPIMQQILIYINEHFTDPLTLKELSTSFGVSISTLSHDFYRYIHHSVYDYILYRRVVYAKQLMFEDKPLSDICYQCGFRNYSNFLRAFQKISGTSPSEYRKQLIRITN